MNALIRWSIRYRGFVALLSVMWLVLGIVLALRAPVDVFPEFVPPQVTIQTEAPGLAPEQVEQIVTRAIESAVVGSPSIENVRSESVYGLSVVLVTFEESVDPYAARQALSERLAALSGKLPASVSPPRLTPLTSSTMDVLKIGLLSDTLDPFALRDLADWTIKQRFLSVPGIARVTVYGGGIRQLQIQPDTRKLEALGLTLTDVMTATREALTLRGGGTIETEAQRITIETPAPSPDPRALAAAVVTVQNGVPIKLGEVATVTFAPALMVGDATIMGRPGVLVTISGQFGANTLDATSGIEKALADMMPQLRQQGVEVYPTIHRPATFVLRALSNLEMALLLGSALILFVLYAFLRSVTAALISFLAIPLSLLAAVVILAQAGQTLNTMTLGGFALALGVLVDDAIIDIENITRRMRLARAAGCTDIVPVIEDASIEIRSSMLYGTLAVIFVFFPILFAGGVQGRFIGPMALTFIIAVLASMVVAMTVTPALCALLLTSSQHEDEPLLMRAMKAAHMATMRVVRRSWGLTVLLLTLGAGAAVSVVPRLHSELIPQFREGHFVLQMATAAPGTSIDQVSALGIRISNAILKLPFVDTIAHQIGRAESGEDTWSPDRSEFHIELTPEHTQSEEEAQGIIRETLRDFPEVRTETLTFLGDRISESLSGETAQVVINVLGNDLDDLDKAAAEIQKAVSSIPGVTDLRIPRSATVPTISVKPDVAALSRFGLTAQDALDAVQTAFAGTVAAQTYDGVRTVDVVVILPPQQRNKISELETLMVSNPQTRVLLRNVAAINVGEGRSNIQHEGAQRRVAVTFNGERGYSLRNIVAEARSRVAALKLPAGTFVSFAGQAEAERQGQIRLAALTAISVVLIIACLTMAFHRRSLAALVLINVPFCLIGSLLAIVMSGIGLTLGSLVGLVTVFGIGARNSVMMLSHVEHLVEAEGRPFTADTVYLAASERFVPVFMTALMAALGLVPLALGLGRPGHEIEAPMAITVLGGLASATLLNLGVLPEAMIRLRRVLGLKIEAAPAGLDPAEAQSRQPFRAG